MENKRWFRSKMFWFNIVAIIAMVTQMATGEELIDAGAQATILAFVNLILRLVTKKPLTK